MKAAPLKSDLLVRKGDPARSRFVAPKVVRLQEVVQRKAALAPVAPQSAGPSQRPARQSDKGDQARLSVRLDAETHRRLRLLAAYKGASVQDILASAVGRYIEDVNPETWSEVVTILAGREGKLD